MKNLTTGNPLLKILHFSIPVYVGQLFQLSYSLIDTRIIGRILGGNSLAAVGATTSLSDLLIEFINGIICGFGIVISVYCGSKDEKGIRKAIGGTVLLGGIITVILSLSCFFMLPKILAFLNVSSQLEEDANSYISIIILGMLFTSMYNICAAILRAIGDSYTPLLFLIFSNVINVLLDYTFILLLHKGVAGAALATVLSQAVSALICFLYMRKKYRQIVLTKDDMKPSKEVASKLLPTGLSMGFMISFVTLGSLALQTRINFLGFHIIVAHTAARKATSLFLTPFFVLGTALATFCGQNLGAKEYGRIKRGIRDTILLAICWCFVVIIIIYLFAPFIIELITANHNKEMIRVATLYLRINSAFYILPAMICIFRNSMQGFGEKYAPLISSFIELVGKVIIAYWYVPKAGYMGIIVSEPIIWSLMIIPLIANMKKNPIFK